MNPLFGAIIVLAIVAAVLGIAMKAFDMDEGMKKIVRGLFILLCCVVGVLVLLWLLAVLGVWSGGPFYHHGGDVIVR